MNITVIADDFTGAAEAAGIGYRHGQAAEVAFPFAGRRGEGLIAVDTDTRLLSQREASEALRAVGESLARSPGGLVFKKVDSVLRGNPHAETAALAAALGKTAVLLVPVNPSIGRIIRDGHYYVGDRPVAETSFRFDPHHPIVHSHVGRMLGCPEKVTIRRVGDAAPIAGFTVGEAASIEDLRSWARRVDKNVLPAGGGEFLSALMRASGADAVAPLFSGLQSSPTLWIAGSTSESCRNLWRKNQAQGKPMIAIPPAGYCEGFSAASSFGSWKDRVQGALRTEPWVGVAAAEEPSHSSAEGALRIREAFAELVQQLWQARAFRHLMIEGGATAAAILRRLGWTRLAAANEWGFGAVSLHPVEAPDILVSAKPGSYAWPDSLLGFVAK